MDLHHQQFLDEESITHVKQQQQPFLDNEAKLAYIYVHRSSPAVDNQQFLNEVKQQQFLNEDLSSDFNRQNDRVVQSVDYSKMTMPFENSERIPRPRFPPMRTANVNNQSQQQLQSVFARLN